MTRATRKNRVIRSFLPLAAILALTFSNSPAFATTEEAEVVPLPIAAAMRVQEVGQSSGLEELSGELASSPSNPELILKAAFSLTQAGQWQALQALVEEIEDRWILVNKTTDLKVDDLVAAVVNGKTIVPYRVLEVYPGGGVRLKQLFEESARTEMATPLLLEQMGWQLYRPPAAGLEETGESKDPRWQRVHQHITRALQQHPGGRLTKAELATLAQVSSTALYTHHYQQLVAQENARRAAMKRPPPAIELQGRIEDPVVAITRALQQHPGGRLTREKLVALAQMDPETLRRHHYQQLVAQENARRREANPPLREIRLVGPGGLPASGLEENKEDGPRMPGRRDFLKQAAAGAGKVALSTSGEQSAPSEHWRIKKIRIQLEELEQRFTPALVEAHRKLLRERDSGHPLDRDQREQFRKAQEVRSLLYELSLDCKAARQEDHVDVPQDLLSQIFGWVARSPLVNDPEDVDGGVLKHWNAVTHFDEMLGLRDKLAQAVDAFRGLHPDLNLPSLAEINDAQHQAQKAEYGPLDSLFGRQFAEMAGERIASGEEPPSVGELEEKIEASIAKIKTRESMKQVPAFVVEDVRRRLAELREIQDGFRSLGLSTPSDVESEIQAHEALLVQLESTGLEEPPALLGPRPGGENKEDGPLMPGRREAIQTILRIGAGTIAPVKSSPQPAAQSVVSDEPPAVMHLRASLNEARGRKISLLPEAVEAYRRWDNDPERDWDNAPEKIWALRDFMRDLDNVLTEFKWSMDEGHEIPEDLLSDTINAAAQSALIDPGWGFGQGGWDELLNRYGHNARPRLVQAIRTQMATHQELETTLLDTLLEKLAQPEEASHPHQLQDVDEHGAENMKQYRQRWRAAREFIDGVVSTIETDGTWHVFSAQTIEEYPGLRMLEEKLREEERSRILLDDPTHTQAVAQLSMVPMKTPIDSIHYYYWTDEELDGFREVLQRDLSIQDLPQKVVPHSLWEMFFSDVLKELFGHLPRSADAQAVPIDYNRLAEDLEILSGA